MGKKDEVTAEDKLFVGVDLTAARQYPAASHEIPDKEKAGMVGDIPTVHVEDG